MKSNIYFLLACLLPLMLVFPLFASQYQTNNIDLETAQKLIPKGYYQDYEQKDYQVIAVGVNTETQQIMVHFRQLFGNYLHLMGPVTMFLDSVYVDNVTVPRFQKLHGIWQRNDWLAQS